MTSIAVNEVPIFKTLNMLIICQYVLLYQYCFNLQVGAKENVYEN